MNHDLWIQPSLTVRQLRRAFQQRHLRPGKRRKRELGVSLREHDAARRIQRFHRRRVPPPCNTTDPLTLETLRSDWWRLFCFRTTEGSCVAYQPGPLAEYVISSGSDIDPLTRQQYAAHDLRRLQFQAHCQDNLVDAVERARRDADEPQEVNDATNIVNAIELMLTDVRDLVTLGEGVAIEDSLHHLMVELAPALHVTLTLLASIDRSLAVRTSDHVHRTITQMAIEATGDFVPPERSQMVATTLFMLGDVMSRAHEDFAEQQGERP